MAVKNATPSVKSPPRVSEPAPFFSVKRWVGVRGGEPAAIQIHARGLQEFIAVAGWAGRGGKGCRPIPQPIGGCDNIQQGRGWRQANRGYIRTGDFEGGFFGCRFLWLWFYSFDAYRGFGIRFGGCFRNNPRRGDIDESRRSASLMFLSRI